MSVRFTEPPSVEGTGGGQIGEGALGAVAVVLAACGDVSRISPGSSKGDCGFTEAELVAPAAPPADPIVVDDPAVVPDGDAGEGDDRDGKGDVGTPRGSDPRVFAVLAVLVLLLAWPFSCNMVWPCCPWAAVMPRNMIAMMKTSCIAFSCIACCKAALSPYHQTTPEPRKTKMKFRKGKAGNRAAHCRFLFPIAENEDHSFDGLTNWSSTF
jgi:hypothetical protein